MLTAVWVAVIVAAAFWVIAVCVAVYLMLAAARLVSQTTIAVADLRQRGHALMDRAEDVTRRAGQQVATTEAITASMGEVTAAMEDLNGRLTGLAPAARSLAEGAGLPLSKIAAVVYGVARAIGMRRAAARGGGLVPAGRGGGLVPAGGGGGLEPGGRGDGVVPASGRDRLVAAGRGNEATVSRRRSRPALAGRRNGVAG
jgi:hypothetical protein